ncbi:MAG: TetR/AcrR family transcriptional regulator [Actinomycetota bacterium]|nr:TetR/AcrR family transcriptional regulator [Actinomycetota bacterium]
MARVGSRQRIVEAAASLFGDRGYHATSIRDIAEESGMLSGSLYAHIRSKEDLLFEIVRRAGEQFIAAVGPVAEADLPPADRLRQALRAHLGVITASLHDARVFLLDWTALDEPRRGEIAGMRDRYEALWDRVLAGFPGIDVPVARKLILGAANWVHAWYDPGGELTSEQVADSFARMLWGGLVGASGGNGKIRNRDERRVER